MIGERSVDFGRWRITIVLPSELGSVSAVLGNQVHGGTIVMDSVAATRRVDADGIIVQKAGIMVGIETADCMPLIIMAQNIAAVLHVSRKSLIAGLLDNLVNFINPQTISNIFIGPHICFEHLTFSWEGSEITAFRQKFPAAVQTRAGTLHLSLRDAVQCYFDQWNMTVRQIHEDGRCTYEASELPSYRRWRKSNEGDFPRFLTTVQLLSSMLRCSAALLSSKRSL